jgi:hypothetical protein
VQHTAIGDGRALLPLLLLLHPAPLPGLRSTTVHRLHPSGRVSSHGGFLAGYGFRVSGQTRSFATPDFLLRGQVQPEDPAVLDTLGRQGAAGTVTLLQGQQGAAPILEEGDGLGEEGDSTLPPLEDYYDYAEGSGGYVGAGGRALPLRLGPFPYQFVN